jgi:hypothetical protein
LARFRALALAAALLAPAIGCGTADSEREARGSVERFYAAFEAEDGAAACAQLSDAASAALETSAGQPCDRAVLSLRLTPAAVAAASVWVTSAEVSLEGGEAAFLDQIEGNWKIGAVGCRPQPGEPDECELEG